jgi:hypothetical protein
MKYTHTDLSILTCVYVYRIKTPNIPSQITPLISTLPFPFTLDVLNLKYYLPQCRSFLYCSFIHMFHDNQLHRLPHLSAADLCSTVSDCVWSIINDVYKA